MPKLSSLAVTMRPAAMAILACALAACSFPIPTGRPSSTPNSLTAASLPPPPVVVADGEAPATDHGEPIGQAVSFRGVLPCADCSGQRITLTLFPDWTYRQRITYLGTRTGKDQAAVSNGTWERQTPGPYSRIGLSDGTQYEFASPSTLRLLSQIGEAINSSLNYTLTQQFELDPIK